MGDRPPDLVGRGLDRLGGGEIEAALVSLGIVALEAVALQNVRSTGLGEEEGGDDQGHHPPCARGRLRCREIGKMAEISIRRRNLDPRGG